MRLVSQFWVLAGRRVIEAQQANPFPSVDDAQFLTSLFNDIEIARMENGPIFLDVEEWRRLHSLIPDAKPVGALKMSDRQLVEALGAPKEKPVASTDPFVPSSTAPLTDSKVETHLTEVPAVSPVSAISGPAPDNVVEMHPPLRPEDAN